MASPAGLTTLTTSFQLNPDKNPGVCLFVSVFICVFVFTCWPYIVGFIVLYAIAKGISAPRHNNNYEEVAAVDAGEAGGADDSPANSPHCSLAT